VLAIWKGDYNTVRPHSGLGNLAPSIYAGLSAPKMQRDGTLRYTEAPRPIPLHHRAIKAQINTGLYSSLDERRGSGQNRQSRWLNFYQYWLLIERFHVCSGPRIPLGRQFQTDFIASFAEYTREGAKGLLRLPNP
jgi:hypothetical protein